MQPTGTEEIVYRAVVAGWIEIRSDGSIWRVAQRRKSRWDGTVTVKPVPPTRIDAPVGAGYRKVKLMVDGKQTSTEAHRLVWRHFNGPIPDGLTINHRNGRKADNQPTNLELATYQEQMRHAIDVLGLHQRLANQHGEKNHMAKLSASQVAEIRRRRAAGEQLTEIAADFGVAFQTVSKIARGDRRFLG